MRKKKEKIVYTPVFRALYIDPSKKFMKLADYEEDPRGDAYTVLKVLGEPGEYHSKLENGDVLYVTGPGIKNQGEHTFGIPFVKSPIYGKAVIMRFSNMHATRRGKCNTSIVKLRKDIKYYTPEEIRDINSDEENRVFRG